MLIVLLLKSIKGINVILLYVILLKSIDVKGNINVILLKSIDVKCNINVILLKSSNFICKIVKEHKCNLVKSINVILM